MYYRVFRIDHRIHRDIICWFETGRPIVIKGDCNHAPNDCFEAISKVELLCLMPAVVVLEYTKPGTFDGNWVEAEDWK